MTKRLLLNTGWHFHAGFDPAWITLPLPGGTVRLPHNAVDLPWNYGDEKAYQKAFTYQRILNWDEGFEGQEVVLCFEGAMAGSKVWVNGHQVVDHPDGYTPFEARLTEHLEDGENLITVSIDGSENGDIPPFGGRIDYLTYAGIYRDVWLEVRPSITIDNIKVEIIDPMAETTSAKIKVWLTNPQKKPVAGAILIDLLNEMGDPIGDPVGFPLIEDHGQGEVTLGKGLARWSPNNPALHTLRVTYRADDGETSQDVRIGIRKAEFRPDGFFLNELPLKIMGLNRHQSFPHVGYALGPEAQAQDADTLKFELGCNLVRTSHYPQSKAFLDRCDEIGLLVFEEIPGWQHIGGQAFQDQSVANVDAMIRRDWNHPSIILWGVRINESADDDAFYTRTNELARELDPTRQTGGVRCIPDSRLLEDVYTMNDFVLGEEHLPEFLQSRRNRPRTPLRDQREVTGLTERVPYLVTEYNGHMYPTKIFDGEERQEEHVLRHLEVVNAAHGDPYVAGSIGWCMFDYNTHADFGSGDRICYHGVMTMTRAPKFAASVYTSQGLDPVTHPVLQPVTHWSFGDRKVGGIFPLIILTNCDEVSFQFGEDAPLTFQPAYEKFPFLPHPPVIIEANDLPEEKRVAWGDSWKDGAITGYLSGKPVIERHYVAAPVPTTLDAVAKPIIRPQDAYHDVPVQFTARDQIGNRLPYLMDQIQITLDGPAVLQGPSNLPMVGGIAGCWVRVLGDEPVTLIARTISGCLPQASLTING